MNTGLCTQPYDDDVMAQHCAYNIVRTTLCARKRAYEIVHCHEKGDLAGNSGRFQSVASRQPKGELGGTGEFVNQYRLVANTQRSSSLKLADFPGTKVLALVVLVSK